MPEPQRWTLIGAHWEDEDSYAPFRAIPEVDGVVEVVEAAAYDQLVARVRELEADVAFYAEKNVRDGWLLAEARTEIPEAVRGPLRALIDALRRRRALFWSGNVLVEFDDDFIPERPITMVLDADDYAALVTGATESPDLGRPGD